MYKNLKLGLFRLLDVIVILTMLFGGPMNVYAAPLAQDATPALATDKTDYASGETVHISGANFAAGDYLLRAIGPDANIADWGSVTADDTGAFQSDSPQMGASGSYELRAYPAGWSGDWSESPVAGITFTVTAPAPIDTPTVEPTTEPTQASTTEPTVEPTVAPTETATSTPAPAPFIRSDKDDYFAGETVTLTSGNWQPN